MRNLCSKGRCTAKATRVLVFDAQPGPGGEIGIRAQVFACDRHRDELAAAVGAHGDVEALV